VTTDELKTKVKENLKLTDGTHDLTITDVIQEVSNHCNLDELPESLEPFIRKKVKAIINYEAENGSSSVFDVKSLHEGDTTITYNVDDKTSKETIYGLSAKDKESLSKFRRLRR
jgi:hypothetical protein